MLKGVKGWIIGKLDFYEFIIRILTGFFLQVVLHLWC